MAIGLLLTAAGSAWYHHAPDDVTLVWDRIPMTVVFAGMMAVVVAQRFSTSASPYVLVLMLVFGVASVLYWKYTGNLSPYIVVQFGSLAALLLIVVMRRGTGDPFPWTWVIVWYVLAKAAEFADGAIWRLTHELVAGHALKHVLAAAAAVAALWPLFRRPPRNP
jgi:hypothetical protein